MRSRAQAPAVPAGALTGPRVAGWQGPAGAAEPWEAPPAVRPPCNTTWNLERGKNPWLPSGGGVYCTLHLEALCGSAAWCTTKPIADPIVSGGEPAPAGGTRPASAGWSPAPKGRRCGRGGSRHRPSSRASRPGPASQTFARAGEGQDDSTLVRSWSLLVQCRSQVAVLPVALPDVPGLRRHCERNGVLTLPLVAGNR